MTSLTGPLALSADVLLIPVAELPAESRDRIDCGPGDVAVSRMQGRTGSKIVDADAARLLARFREPRSIVEAVILYGREERLEPSQVLEDAYPLLRGLVEAGFLVAPGETPPAEAEVAAGAALLGGTVVRSLQVLDDTAVHVLDRDGRASVVKLEQRAGSPIGARLAREAAFLAHLDGALSPRLLGRGDHEGRAALEIELVAGTDAAAAAAEWREQDGGRDGLLGLLRAVARAYADLHERGVLHGDVHPRNTLVEADGRVRLVDFGLASGLPGGALPVTAERGGVPFFYEPELARASLAATTAPASLAGEQHAVAALLYLLATGAHWQDFRLARLDMLEDIATREPLEFRARGVAPWPELEPVLARALAKDAADRYGSLGELADALDRVPTAPGPRPAPSRTLARPVDEALAAAGLDGPWLRDGLQPAPTTSVNYGAAGVAAALLQIALRREDARVLALADVWARRAARHLDAPDAFHNADIQITPEVVGLSSPYHAPSGVHAVAALIARARADARGQAAAVTRFLEAVQRPAAGLDLTLGLSSTLVGAALLLDATPDAWPEARALRAFGERTQAEVWEALDAKPAVAHADVDYPGLAHGWAGFAYAALQWCRVSGAAVPAGLPGRLDELARLARPVGRGLEWPWMLRGGAQGSTMAGWCNGTCGHLFLWTLAAEVVPDPRWLRTALGAGWNTWEASGGGVTLCCGLAGRAYALLALHRVTGDAAWLRRARTLAERAAAPGQAPGDHPHALYKGGLGVAVLAADLERPAEAALPLFEPARYRG